MTPKAPEKQQETTAVETNVAPVVENAPEITEPTDADAPKTDAVDNVSADEENDSDSEKTDQEEPIKDENKAMTTKSTQETQPKQEKPKNPKDGRVLVEALCNHGSFEIGKQYFVSKKIVASYVGVFKIVK